ncbi:MAG TPA: hypothetical protein VIE65_15345 [Methylobacter sp.]|jgi:cell division protein FtsB
MGEINIKELHWYAERHWVGQILTILADELDALRAKCKNYEAVPYQENSYKARLAELENENKYLKQRISDLETASDIHLDFMGT